MGPSCHLSPDGYPIRLRSISAFSRRLLKHHEQNPNRQVSVFSTQEPMLGSSRSSTTIHSKAAAQPRQFTNDDNDEEILHLEAGIGPCVFRSTLSSLFNSN